MPKIRVTRKAYKRDDGTRVKKTTFLTKDKGKKGRTPKEDRWYESNVHTGWKKEQPASVRRMKVQRAHKNDLLASARSMQALSNVTTDKQTRMKAEADSTYFFKKYAQKKGFKSTARSK